MRKYGSVLRGILEISRPYHEPRPGWAIKRLRGGPYFWAHWWTPIWHEGRGPYLSIGLGFFSIMRGY